MRTRSRTSALLAALAAGSLLLSACAEFPDSASGQDFQPAPEVTPEAGPNPNQESGGPPASPPPSSRSTPVPPPQGCTDFNPAVIGTCMDLVTAVAGLPGADGNPTALAGERGGKVWHVAPKAEKREFATLGVESLLGLALSPTYAEDQLVFAYVTTATDSRVVRFAQGQEAKPVLTGLPKGPGTIAADRKGALLVATGDGGNPGAAADPNSMAGKVLRIDAAGKPAAGNPTAGSAVLSSGLRSPGGLCANADGSRIWVTDRAPDKDLLYRVTPGRPLAVPAWTWADRPGVAGCVDWGNVVSVAASVAANLQSLPVTPEGAVSGKPSATLDAKGGGFGRLAGIDMITPQLAVGGTVNKDGGQPVSSDDRAVLIVPQGASGGPGKD
ncbi:PQQ-dependent sugar dehydrogenase [Amycolatopsis suaedae]|uniref:Glucose dehydrogenase n=1 Tax=Amycolatopsis suaedae TaxID=2510978 RepID=A0A4Q7JB70_9PSEU|nr:PQQ-dependent sugar dehydrogenase [Amycolatopsis suaedae]RZQ64529.1 glucose dehydrogenase [Amycolatopsis suaedae]